MALAKQDVGFILDRTQVELQAVADYTENKWDDQAAVFFPWIREHFIDEWFDLPREEVLKVIESTAPQQISLDPGKWLGYIERFIMLAQLIRKLLGK